MTEMKIQIEASTHNELWRFPARVAFVILAWGVFVSPSAFADAPENDSCTFATPFEIGTTVSGTTEGATRDDVPMCDVGGVAPGVWYSVIGDGSKFSLNICSSFDTPTVSVYCYPCERPGCVVSKAWLTGDPCSASSLEWCTQLGVEYLILVQSYNAGTSGPFNLTITSDQTSCPRGAPCLRPPSPPINDQCAEAVAIEGEDEFPYTLDGATSAPGQGVCGFDPVAIQKDVWIAWTSTRTDTAALGICGSSSAPVTVSVYQGCDCSQQLVHSECLLLDPVVCGQTYLYPPLGAAFAATEGQCYLLQVGVAHLLGGGSGELRITYGEPESLPCTITTSSFENPCTARGGWDAIKSTGSSEVVVDNFRVVGDEQLTGLCFWGAYFNGTPDDCQSWTPDDFVVTYYADNCGIPGNVIGGPFEQSNGTLVVQGPVFTGRRLTGGVFEYEYSVEHAPLSLTESTDYWVSVANSAETDCQWYWERGSSTQGLAYVDGLHGEGANGFDRDEAIVGDLSYCMQASLAEPDPDCSDPPHNDQCADAALIDEGGTEFITIGATTDGVGRDLSESVSVRGCDFSLGDETVSNDVWFVYEATCSGNLQAGTCDSNFDTKIIVYPKTTCPPAYNDAIACNDDACGGGDVALQSQVDVSVRKGERYLIRVGGYRGSTGVGTLMLDIAPPVLTKMSDYATLARCFTGSCSMSVCEPALYEDRCCQSTDFDGDGDVDLDDYEFFRVVFTGP